MMGEQAQQQQDPVRVFGLGLDDRFKAMLKVFFMRGSGGAYILSDNIGDMLVVDMDAVGAKDLYDQHCENNRRVPTILFAFGESKYRTQGNIIVLRKPFTVRQLQSAFDILSIRYLGRARGVVMPAAFGESEAVRQQRAKLDREARQAREAEKDAALKTPLSQVPDKAAPEKPGDESAPVSEGRSFKKKKGKAKASVAAFSLSSHDEYIKLNALSAELGEDESGKTYQPEHYLEGVLVEAWKKARKRHTGAEIKLAGGSIKLDPETELAQIRMGDFQLREACSFELARNTWQVSWPTGEHATIDPKEKGKLVPLRSLIWKTALYASRGRVPPGTETDDFYQLRHWPNLTRKMLTPAAVRVSAVWISQPASIEQLAKQLGLPERDIASYFSAANALGLFKKVSKTSIGKRSEKKKSRKGGLFKRILNRLRSF